MNQDLSIIELVLHASIVVKIVIAGLLLMSLFSWGLIFSKLGSLGKIKRRNEAFEQDFWSGKSLTDLYAQASNQAETGPLERLFSSGMREFMKLRDRRLDTAHAARRRAPRDEGQPAARARRDRGQPRLPRLGRLGQPVRGPVRHGVGHHERVRRPVQHDAGDAGHRRAGHRRGAGRHRDRPVLRDPRGRRLQPLRARHRPHRHAAGQLQRRVLQHPATQRRRAPGRGRPRAEPRCPASSPAAAAAARSARSTWCRSSTSCWCC